MSVRRLRFAMFAAVLVAASAVLGATPPLAWKQTRGLEGGPVFDLAVDPHDADVVFARGPGGLLVTRNGGESWESRRGPGKSDPPIALSLDSTGSELRLQISTGWVGSVDGGRIWRAVPAPEMAPDVPWEVRESQALVGAQLYASPADAQRVFAVGDHVVKVSRDGGRTFVAGVAAPGQESGFSDRLLPDSRDPNAIVMATREGIFRSADAGASWQPATGVGPGRRDGWSHILQHPLNVGWLYVAEPAALLRSKDAGRTWMRIGTSPDSHVHSLAIAPTAPNRIYASSWRGLHRSDDEGRSWRSINGGAAVAMVNHLAADPSAPLSVYAPAINRLYHSADGGASWQPIDTAVEDTWFGAVTFDTGAPGTIYLGSGKGTCRSVDGGRSWARFGPPDVRAVAVDPQRRGTLYGVNSLDMPLVSQNDGARWDALSPRLPIDRAIELADATQLGQAPFLFADLAAAQAFIKAKLPASYNRSGMVRAPLTGAVAASDKRCRYLAWVGGFVSRTEDGGATWVTSEAFANKHINALAVHPRNPRCVFAATHDDTVWMSLDGARTWRDVGDGVRDLPYSNLLLLPTTPCIALISTRGLGVFRAELPATP